MKQTLIAYLLAVSVIIAFSCGETPDQITPGPGPGPGPGPVVNITDEQRVAVLKECSTFIGTLGDLKSEPAQQILVAWLRSRPEFEEAGITHGNVWAYFYDGRIAMMLPDWKRDPASGGTIQWPAVEVVAPPKRTTDARSGI